MYLGLRRRRVVAAPIAVCFDFEKQIQNTEITHEALTRRRTAARMRSPRSPAARQTAFRVMIRQIPTVSAVKITILMTLLNGEMSLRRAAPKGARLSGMETRIAEFAGYLTVPVDRRTTFFMRDKQNLNQRPITLPIASAPKYSSQSNQGRIRSHPSNGLL